MTKETGGTAFPLDYETAVETQSKDSSQYGVGMTLRDYFAAKAMILVTEFNGLNFLQDETIEKYIARRAYEIADAMLEARK